ncbi:MAG: NAD(P)H-binding protein [Alphaproteobacteria bacterium]|nr:NAD(P)H-binding protein [Alphaproteobacteria bacterium]
MRALVLGAAGFVGRHVVAGLLDAGHDVVAAARRPAEIARRFPAARAVACDLARDDAAAWRSRLDGVDVVVNAAGLLRDPGLQAVHVDGPRALYDACKSVGVRRVVLVSAISADPEAGTDYARTKLAGEALLRESGLDWVVLRPSLIYAEGSFGGTSLMRGLAALPWAVLLPGDGGQRFQPIHVEDLVVAVLRALEGPLLACRTVEPVGPDTLTLKEMLVAWRAWLDIPAGRLLRVPMAVIWALARLGDLIGKGPLSTVSVRQMEHGNVGDPAAFAAAVGFAPRRFVDWLQRRPSHVQDRWHARMYFARSLLRLGLGAFWVGSGVIGLWAPMDFVAEVFQSFRVPEAWWTGLARAACLVDIAIGLGVWLRWQGAHLAQAGVTLAYTLIFTLAAPAIWVDPLGAILKNAAVLAAIAAYAAIEDDR